MKFTLKTDCTFEAEDLDEACILLAEYFLSVAVSEHGALELAGRVELCGGVDSSAISLSNTVEPVK